MHLINIWVTNLEIVGHDTETKRSMEDLNSCVYLQKLFDTS